MSLCSRTEQQLLFALYLNRCVMDEGELEELGLGSLPVRHHQNVS